MAQILIQLIIIVAVLFVLGLLKRFLPSQLRQRLRVTDVVPPLCLWAMWQLSHTWSDPWYAWIILIWMSISIALTLWWGLSRGEILWNQFLIFYWRLTTLLLIVAYGLTILSAVLR